MISIITDNSPRDEASPTSRTFDLVRWVRARRLQWLGHILLLGSTRTIKQAVFEMFKAPTDVDLLMDTQNGAVARAVSVCSRKKGPGYFVKPTV